MVPREEMCTGAKKLRDAYAIIPNAPIYQKEFGYYCLDRWYEQGLPKDANLSEVFQYDEPGNITLKGLGWTEAGFDPYFDEIQLEDRGDYEVVQDFAGRSVLFFKGRRKGFMPTYINHPVKDKKTWYEKCAWRMDPNSPNREKVIQKRIPTVIEEAKKGKIVTQNVIGGYMYLRSLFGPEDIMYMFYDNPKLIHTCMEAWFNLADNIIARHQKYVTIDELALGEDISYRSGLLISPKMIKEFLFPYYQQLIENIKKRQIDKNRKLILFIDTDGNLDQVLPLYSSIGMNVISPMEVAAGADVVKIGEQYPDLVLIGGIDKRVLAAGKDAIDKYLAYVMPPMKKRGGYIPSCDHGVPEEVKLEDYLYYRKRMIEYMD